MHCAYFEPLAETQVSTIHLIVKYSKSEFLFFFEILYADGLWLLSCICCLANQMYTVCLVQGTSY